MIEKTGRRNAIKNIVTSSIALTTLNTNMQPFDSQEPELKLKNNISHSVCQWTYDFLSLEELCATAKKIGLKAIDLLKPSQWATAKKFGLDSSMCYTNGKISLADGWGDLRFRDNLIKEFTEGIPLAAQAGYKNIICFSGSRRGMDDATGLDNCTEGLKKVIGLAEKHGITLQMELLNSKKDHKDYMCDKTAWGVELCKKLNSPNFKLLYDIYHMQIDEGDVISTIRQYHPYIGHYHTAGVPGRNELNDKQELYYPAIMREIVKTGFKGYVAHEFIPTPTSNADKIKSLKQAVAICDI